MAPMTLTAKIQKMPGFQLAASSKGVRFGGGSVGVQNMDLPVSHHYRTAASNQAGGLSDNSRGGTVYSIKKDVASE